MPKVGVREAAKILGVSHPALIKARKTGALQFEADGTVDTDRALLSEWGLKHQADRAARSKGSPPANPPAGIPPGVVVRRVPEPEAPDKGGGVVTEAEPQPRGGWLKRRRRVEGEEGENDDVAKIDLEKDLLIERAERYRMENEVRRAKLVDRAEVESATEMRIRADAEALLNWPACVSAQMASELGVEEHVMHATLDKYVRQFMTGRSKATIAASPAPE